MRETSKRGLVRLPDASRRELQCLTVRVPFLVTDLSTPWGQVAFATDTSTEGYGVVQKGRRPSSNSQGMPHTASSGAGWSASRTSMPPRRSPCTGSTPAGTRATPRRTRRLPVHVPPQCATSSASPTSSADPAASSTSSGGSASLRRPMPSTLMSSRSTWRSPPRWVVIHCPPRRASGTGERCILAPNRRALLLRSLMCGFGRFFDFRESLFCRHIVIIATRLGAAPPHGMCRPRSQLRVMPAGLQVLQAARLAEAHMGVTPSAKPSVARQGACPQCSCASMADHVSNTSCGSSIEAEQATLSPGRCCMRKWCPKLCACMLEVFVQTGIPRYSDESTAPQYVWARDPLADGEPKGVHGFAANAETLYRVRTLPYETGRTQANVLLLPHVVGQCGSHHMQLRGAAGVRVCKPDRPARSRSRTEHRTQERMADGES